MGTKPITDYLNEFSNPSLKCSPNERLVNPMEITQYLNWVESLRFAFVAEVLSCENAAIKSVYINELKQAILKMRKRGFCNLRDEDITAAIVAGVSEMELVNQVVVIDRGLLASAQKALKVLSPAEDEVLDAVPEEEPTKANENEIITGVRGLATVLNIGINKAQAIVNSKILEKEGIQWNAGHWKFNKVKLLDFVKNNPDAFAKIKSVR